MNCLVCKPIHDLCSQHSYKHHKRYTVRQVIVIIHTLTPSLMFLANASNDITDHSMFLHFSLYLSNGSYCAFLRLFITTMTLHTHPSHNITSRRPTSRIRPSIHFCPVMANARDTRSASPPYRHAALAGAAHRNAPTTRPTQYASAPAIIPRNTMTSKTYLTAPISFRYHRSYTIVHTYPLSKRYNR